MTRFLVVPQWQGSPAPRAMLLTEGASAIAGDLPSARTTVLEIPLEAGDAEGTGVHRLSSLRRTRELIEEAITAHAEPTLVVGGDCGVSVAAVAALPGALHDVAIVWFDAHPDLHTPESSVSGAYAGMALRALLGHESFPIDGPAGLTPERTVLVGARSEDDAESEYLAGSGIVRLDEVEDAQALAEAVAATGASRVYVHIDVDVLDPSELAGVSSAVPFGLRTTDVVSAVKALRERLPLAGATIAGFAPRSPGDAVQDLGAILRLIGALA
ncbi:arginase family protein [Microbacterium sp. Au-Mic1]|uniref:arginase family protein n=1 Tax=Microbacterium sp. Au-Mic1 TaxID=2906457 RepID=UPI001E64E666|nr:arginase family protein [Microbacterium sp. Au-Mic1]MCE4025791.1 arginase family protein [Microbacterium sp. Au-Mic1]